MARKNSKEADKLLVQAGNVRFDEDGDDIVIRIRKDLEIGKSKVREVDGKKKGGNPLVASTRGFTWLTCGVGISLNAIKSQQ